MQNQFIFPAVHSVPRVFTADNFYSNPDAVRHFASEQMFYTCVDYVGSRTDTFLFDGVKESMEDIMGARISDWENFDNGRFEVYAGGDLSPIFWEPVYDWTGYVFLNPGAPAESGITLQKHKKTGSFVGNAGLDFNPLDKFQFDRADTLGNIYNRLVLIHGRLLRNYSEYFGWDLGSGMMLQTFKFNVRR